MAESHFKHVRQWLIKGRVNRNCKKEPYLVEVMHSFIFVPRKVRRSLAFFDGG